MLKKSLTKKSLIKWILIQLTVSTIFFIGFCYVLKNNVPLFTEDDPSGFASFFLPLIVAELIVLLLGAYIPAREAVKNLKKLNDMFPSRRNIIRSAVITFISVVTGIGIIGAIWGGSIFLDSLQNGHLTYKPDLQITEKLEDARIDINSFVSRHNKLPQSLDELDDNNTSKFIGIDYRPTANIHISSNNLSWIEFELCGTFKYSTLNDYPEEDPMRLDIQGYKDYRAHNKGKQCFTENVQIQSSDESSNSE